MVSNHRSHAASPPILEILIILAPTVQDKRQELMVEEGHREKYIERGVMGKNHLKYIRFCDFVIALILYGLVLV